MKNIKIITIVALVFISCFFPGQIFAAWHTQPENEMQFNIIDETKDKIYTVNNDSGWMPHITLYQSIDKSFLINQGIYSSSDTKYYQSSFRCSDGKHCFADVYQTEDLYWRFQIKSSGLLISLTQESNATLLARSAKTVRLDSYE